ncbi:septal ring lytic transglycosylase RlpA family protein [Brevibacterium metallidurans]|uniref:Probable endolytic peptidoglycan transglycosylase RlpA n=1 Tax=Brevibacterium metallidurans TaxID=1482676 RepID=A0ABN0SKS2_9MICO
MGKHSSTSTKGSILSALKPGKKRSGRHTPEPASAGGVLAAVRSRPVLSAFVVPAAATAAVVGSSFAMVPGATDNNSRVVAESPVVVEVPAASPAADENLKKAEDQAKEKPGKVSLETKTQAPEPKPSTSKSSSSGSGKSSSKSSGSEDSGPSKSGKSAGTSGECPMSFYGGGDGTDGGPTASGERFDASKLTAAHKSLPFGSKVKVTNKANGKTVTVRINDRGPYSGSRCIDLSAAAMKAVGGTGAGVIQGKYEVL